MSSIYLMIEIAIIIGAMGYLGLLVAKTNGWTGKVIENTDITKEVGTVDITRVTGTDATDGRIESLIIGMETESEGIDLKDAVIMITVGNVTSSLKYRNGTILQDIESGYYTR
jgi:archaellin